MYVSCLRVMVPILQWAAFEAREGALLSAGVFTWLRTEGGRSC